MHAQTCVSDTWRRWAAFGYRQLPRQLRREPTEAEAKYVMRLTTECDGGGVKSPTQLLFPFSFSLLTSARTHTHTRTHTPLSTLLIKGKGVVESKGDWRDVAPLFAGDSEPISPTARHHRMVIGNRRLSILA